MRQYLDLLREIYTQGKGHPDRTSVGRSTIFGTRMAFDLREGFPLTTTSALFVKGIVAELLWFISGSTKVQDLKDKGVHFWDAWETSDGTIGPMYGHNWRNAPTMDSLNALYGNPVTRKEFIERLPSDKAGVFKAWLDSRRAESESDLALYGEERLTQMEILRWSIDPRELGGSRHSGYDQLHRVIEDIKHDPWSARLLVNAWFPEFLPPNGRDYDQYVKDGKGALAPCHCLFQFNVEPDEAGNPAFLNLQLYQR